MTIKKAIISHNDFKHLIDAMVFRTSVGSKLLLQSPLLSHKKQIELELSNINWVYTLIENKSKNDLLNLLYLKLESVLDIYSSINRLTTNCILDEIELFEIKKLAITSREIKEIIEKLNLNFVSLPDLTEVVKILDPDNQNIPHFYIYSSYDSKLAKIRDLLSVESDIQKVESLRIESLKIEDKIREELSIKLSKFSTYLKTALDTIAYIDLIFAKAQLAMHFHLVMPEISSGETSYVGLFNPYIQNILQKQNKEFQPINIELNNQPCLLTGINMGGKTVLLKTLGLSQYLFQFGFFVPARNAKISIAEEIFIISGDNQSETNGLSSFASEMIILNNVLKSVKSNKVVFVLLDELARTTNPDEGKAIVNATIDILNSHNTMSIISTHYSSLTWQGRRLKIKGLLLNDKNINIDFKNLSNYMDYSVVEDLDNENSKQAISIAKILGVDTELLSKANAYLTD